MRHNNFKDLKVHILVSLLLMCFASSAFAWRATSLGGDKWMISCANGTNWSYNGSSAGLDIVGPALCPAGVISPDDDMDDPQLPDDLMKNVTKGIPQTFLRAVALNFMEVGDKEPRSVKTFSPDGYPCLECEPCLSGYCDIVTGNIVFIPREIATYVDNKMHIPEVSVINDSGGITHYKADLEETGVKPLTFKLLGAEKKQPTLY